MQGLTPIEMATAVGVMAFMNASAIFGAYVSIRVKLARLEVYVDILRRDVNALGGKFRTKFNQEEKSEESNSSLQK